MTFIVARRSEASGGRQMIQLRSYAFVALLLSISGPAFCQTDPKPLSLTRFQDQIDAFATQDRTEPPPKDAILFVGSSIFREWNSLREQMSPLPVFNRAFGGSRTPEILYYMDTIVLPYTPRIIVYYCGSNDINAGELPADIAKRFGEFVLRVHRVLPKTRIFFVSINRAPEKQDKWDRVDETNRMIRKACSADPRLGFIDVNPALFNADGRPRFELYREDSLHFKPGAYAEFTAIIKPVLERAWRSAD
jgi:lysophospholipase L1-like esterase